MRRTRSSTRRNQDGCPLFVDLHTLRIVISKLAKSDRGSLALTCSLARTTVHSEVTALDFSRAPNCSTDVVTPQTVAQAAQLLQRCLQDSRWARLEALVLPASFHEGICAAAALVQQRWPRLRALGLVRFGSHEDQHIGLVPMPLGSPGLLSSWWTQLTSLCPTGININALAAQRLAQARLGALQELRLDSNFLLDIGFEQLLAAPWPSLGSLTVSGNYLSGAAVRHLAAATQLTALASLGLQRNMLDALGVRALAAATHLGLQRLDLSGNGAVGIEGLAELLEATQLVSGMRSLALNDAGLGYGAGARVAAATQLSCLESFSFCTCTLHGSDLLALAGATHLSTLQQLTLGSHFAAELNGIGKHYAADVLGRMLLPNLTSLSILNASTYASSMGKLAAAALPSLCTLKLNHTFLRKGAIVKLASAQWPQLQTLDLAGNNQLTASVLMQLSRMRRKCPALRCLVVPVGVNAGSVQARLAKGAWEELIVVHARQS